MKQPRNTKTNALKILDRLTGDDAQLRKTMDEERANLDVAHKIYAMRIAAGFSQADLARRIGTTQSVISRLEDADYEGHSMAMLTRIADSLEKRVEIHFVSKRSRLQPA